MATKKLNKTYFISFCIENYKKRLNTDGYVVIDLFDRYGVTDYLNDNYEVLHTQNSHWLMEEIDDFIKSRKEEIAQ